MRSDHSPTLNVLSETAYAEYGSALEMLAACKAANKPTHAYGYFEHAKDEYNHTGAFLSMLSTRSQIVPCNTARQLRFNSSSVITKGYVDSEGYLIENLNIKDFIAFVYTNELLAKSSFEKILKLVGPSSIDGETISGIMRDELRHHGFAEEHFLHYYPALQPWQLRFYRIRETIKNKSRKLIRQNVEFLEKIFKPLYSLMSYLVARLVLAVNLDVFKRDGKNLLDIPTKSIL